MKGWRVISYHTHTHTQLVFWQHYLTCHPSSHSAVIVLPNTWSQNSLRLTIKAGTKKKKIVPKSHRYFLTKENVEVSLISSLMRSFLCHMLITFGPLDFMFSEYWVTCFCCSCKMSLDTLKWSIQVVFEIFAVRNNLKQKCNLRINGTVVSQKQCFLKKRCRKDVNILLLLTYSLTAHQTISMREISKVFRLF